MRVLLFACELWTAAQVRWTVTELSHIWRRIQGHETLVDNCFSCWWIVKRNPSTSVVRTVILTTKKVLFLCLKNQEVAAVLLHDCTCAVTSLVHDPLLEMTSEFVLMFFLWKNSFSCCCHGYCLATFDCHLRLGRTEETPAFGATTFGLSQVTADITTMLS
jgi:hypothetical protein